MENRCSQITHIRIKKNPPWFQKIFDCRFKNKMCLKNCHFYVKIFYTPLISIFVNVLLVREKMIMASYWYKLK